MHLHLSFERVGGFEGTLVAFRDDTWIPGNRMGLHGLLSTF